MIEVKQPGFFTSVQDLGRRGLRHMGVGMSGAMDSVALSITNIMVGNPADTAGLEVTMGNVALTFRQDAEIAIGGADAQAMVDDRPLPNWWTLTVKAGQTLKLNAPRRGLRTYLAFRGGIIVQPVLGSHATDLKGGFGGHEGRILKAGDMLSLNAAASATGANPGFGLSPRHVNPYPELDDDIPVIHVLPAAQWETFTPEAQELFAHAEWSVSPQSNRVGCRLSGPVLEVRSSREMLSHGIMPGVVQVPPSGQPIVQLCDGNTSGGYPVIATVIRANLHLFAQFRQNSAIRFALCDIDTANALSSRQQLLLETIDQQCRLARTRFS